MRPIVTLSLAAGFAVLSPAVDAKTAIFAKPAGSAVGIGGSSAPSLGPKKSPARPTVRPGTASVGGAAPGLPRVGRVNPPVRQPTPRKTAVLPSKIVKGVGRKER